MSFLRHPRTTQERRYAIDGWNRPRRSNHNLPNAYDDYWTKPERCWKNYRKTQYKVAAVPNEVKHEST